MKARSKAKYIVYLNILGTSEHEILAFTSYDLALKCFEQSCSPLLYIEAWLMYTGPHPLFPWRTIRTIEKHWHMREGTK